MTVALISTGGGRMGLSAYEVYVAVEEEAGRTPLSEAAWVAQWESASADRAAAEASATAAATSAAAAATSAATAGTYPSQAAGLAATSDTEYFWTVSGELLQLYLNDGGSAVAQSGINVPLGPFSERLEDGLEGLGMVLFRSTGTAPSADFTAVKNGNNIDVSWSNLEIRTVFGTRAIADLATTTVAVGEGLTLDLTGTFSTEYAVTKETMDTTVYEAARDGDKLILFHQRTNKLAGPMAPMITRALDTAARILGDEQKAWRVLDNSASPAITTAAKNGNNITVGWSQLQVATPHGLRNIAARSAADLNAGQCLYIDLEESYSTEYTVTEAAYGAAVSDGEAAGTRLILLHAGVGRYTGALAPMVARKLESEARSAALDLTYQGPLQPVTLGALNRFTSQTGWNRRRGFKSINAGNNYYQWQNEAFTEERIEIANPNTAIDLTWLQAGASVILWASDASGGKVYLPVNPLGKSGNQAALSQNDVLKVTRVSDLDATAVYAIQELNGTPTWSTVSPTMDQSIAVAGQSNWAIAVESGSVGGWSDRLLSRYGTSHVSTYFIAGATGGTSITGASGWWNSGSPGAALTTYMTAVSDAISAGQPTPAWTLWRQGEQDITQVNTGGLSIADYKTAVQAVFDHIRTTYTTMKFLVSGPQGNDDGEAFNGSQGIRNAYIELASDLAYVYQDGGWYDVPREWNNVHPNDGGYWSMGHRSATAWLKAQGETRDLGPEIGTVTLAADGLSVTVQITGVTDRIEIPYGARGQGADLGPYPFGWTAIVGDPSTEDPITLKSGTVARVSDTEVTLTLYSDTDLTGARLYTFAGKGPSWLKHNFIRNDNVHGVTLGYPMRDQRTAVLS